MFDVSLSWVNGFFQVATYSAVLVVILWVMSKIEIPDRGESPSGEEKGKDNA